MMNPHWCESRHHLFSTRVHRFNHEWDQNDDDNNDDFIRPTALVVGSSGSLGRTLTRYLSSELHVNVIGADVMPPKENDQDHDQQHLHGFVELPLLQPGTSPSLPDLTVAMVDGLSQLLDDDEGKPVAELNAIISVAGGWEGDPVLPPPSTNLNEILDGARQYASTIESMAGKNLYPLLAAGYAANYFLSDDDGLLVAIGATVALGATPGMLGYGLSKAGTHHFVQTLGELTKKGVTTKSRRKLAQRLRAESGGAHNTGMSVIGILPTTIDTEMNRVAMPNADFAQWTKSIDIAKEIGMWMQRPVLRPHSGSLVKVFPSQNGSGATFQLAR